MHNKALSLSFPLLTPRPPTCKYRLQVAGSLARILFLLEGNSWSPMPFASGSCLLWREFLQTFTALQVSIRRRCFHTPPAGG